MLTLDLENVMLEFQDGTIKHVGASDSAASVTLYDVTETEVRAFGDSRIKVAAEDDEGNDVEVALSPEQARSVAERLDSLEGNFDDD